MSYDSTFSHDNVKGAYILDEGNYYLTASIEVKKVSTGTDVKTSLSKFITNETVLSNIDSNPE